MLKEFKAFAMRGNVIDLAVGVIIGGAFGKIVSSFVADIVMPVVNPLIPGGDWKTIEVGPGIKLGNFFGTVVDFLIIAFVIFLAIKGINAAKKKEEAAPAPPAAPPADIVLLTEIRDLLKK
ncbi:MAG TPA: large conductance mechanosensitive channel protein MscL [Chryseolinea sp.]|mgnify:CR=1 FL=1|nr:large conductance mechanosensitive channel protein MscL [Chryseolinea sp.]HPH46416.1 large conductance mechanosensitive channel protein MscL [Chryseolinea sp.]HPM32719.1 large conductance mechanosensitive channel protein MscL [Chryseolinea sp.]